MEHITIKQLDIHHPDYPQVYDLREEVLRKPIGLSLKDEDLSADVLDIILVAQHNEDIIGCVMLHPANDEQIKKLRQMAVAAGWQGRGIGKMLVTASENLLREKGISKIILHARTTAEGFYKNLGYHTTGDIFTEVGIPHIVMEKQL